MKKNMFKLSFVGIVIGLAVSSAMLTGCQPPDKLAWETQEQARSQAIENAKINVKTFRADHQEFASKSIYMRGDSTISETCGQGDGFASIDLVDQENPNIKVELKCSTVSPSIGCMTKADFQTRDYSKQEGSCDRSLPFPIRKMVE